MGNFQTRVLSIEEYEQWNEFVDQSPQGSIFAKSFWLNAVGATYSILGCFDKSGKLVAGMPIVQNKRNHITMPKLTQTLGIVFADFSSMKYVNCITKEKDISMEIVENIPDFDYFDCAFHYNFTNWMPFMWKGYEQHTRYTYVIEELQDIDEVRKAFTDNTKSLINRAVKSKVQVIRSSQDECPFTIREMYNMLHKTYARQGKPVPFDLPWFEYFDKVLAEKQAREIFFAVDDEKQLHAALYLVYDRNSAYYLLGGGDPDFRSSGAMYLNVFEALKYAADKTKKFDFEGSIVPQIEHMFRSFGAKQKQYFRVTKNKSILLHIKQDIKKYGKLLLKRG